MTSAIIQSDYDVNNIIGTEHGIQYSTAIDSNSQPSASIPDEEVQYSMWNMFKRHIPRLILTVLVDIVIPLVLYFVLQKYLLSVYALLIAGCPALIMVIVKAVWSRTFDGIGFLVFIGFFISAIVAIITKNARVLVFEKSLITAVMSAIFLVSLIPFHIRCGQRVNLKLRPLVYYFYMDLIPMGKRQAGLSRVIIVDQHDNRYRELQEEIDDIQQTTSERLIEPSKEEVEAVYDWIYHHCSSFRYSCYGLTILWAIGFMVEFGGRLALVFAHLSVNIIVLYANVMLAVVASLCALSSMIIIIIERRQTMNQIKQWQLENLHHTPTAVTHMQV
ncbi:unnamed protein product [Didymodactylos carnosus]|uniref:Uncharacterized protein n=1 Tax=Didymodactylos carnosus TaxID=1234261 RepID=A0A814DCA2_9BILA|nr:unnamed protein product [Didymodactylos carnosus]CAF0961370.1 unnamed protein product [Didymodactylos carnosus]CAF3727376.1 unnamed protein product [Didymodactylos carnosus]CAF3734186.1 unnamed protein product [Didymodactylos carnosus]